MARGARRRFLGVGARHDARNARKVTGAMSSTQSKPTVLIVDDDPQIRRMLVEVLSLEGYPVETAADGREALEKLAASESRVVLLDLLMPVLDGRGVMRQLESDGRRANHRIILVSALTNLETNRDLAADARLPKPFTVDQLMNVVQAADKKG
jgi:CheY-like chemotaxis protein